MPSRDNKVSDDKAFDECDTNSDLVIPQRKDSTTFSIQKETDVRRYYRLMLTGASQEQLLEAKKAADKNAVSEITNQTQLTS